MGVIRGILVVFVSVLLFISILFMTLSWTLSSSLSYENVQKQGSVVFEDDLQDQISLESHIQSILPAMQTYCQSYSDYVVSYQGYTFDIPCDVVMQGEEAIVDEGIKDMIHEIYYTGYDCNFFDCFKDSTIPMFLVSEKAYNYWANKFSLSLMASLILVVLLFILVEKKTNTPIIIGSFMIVSSLPFIKLDQILSLFSDKMFVQFLSIFFSQAYQVSVQILTAGIILLILGIILKFFKIGFFISKIISKFKDRSKVKVDKKQLEKLVKKETPKKKKKLQLFGKKIKSKKKKNSK